MLVLTINVHAVEKVKKSSTGSTWWRYYKSDRPKKSDKKERQETTRPYKRERRKTDRKGGAKYESRAGLHGKVLSGKYFTSAMHIHRPTPSLPGSFYHCILLR
jgi:hypothetical protein